MFVQSARFVEEHKKNPTSAYQFEAVCKELRPRQPLRFMLADDPGADRTIMLGLYIPELVIRGDVERRLAVPPRSLFEDAEPIVRYLLRPLEGEEPQLGIVSETFSLPQLPGIAQEPA